MSYSLYTQITKLINISKNSLNPTNYFDNIESYFGATKTLNLIFDNIFDGILDISDSKIDSKTGQRFVQQGDKIDSNIDNIKLKLDGTFENIFEYDTKSSDNIKFTKLNIDWLF